MPQPDISVMILAATALAAVADARSGRIPNALTLPLVGLAPLVQLSANGLGGLLSSVLGTVLCAVPPLFLFLRNAMGGGDLKLFCGIGAALGPFRGLELQLTAYCIAAAYAAWLLIRERRLLRTLGSVLHLGSAPADGAPSVRTDAVRLGIPIFLAALWCVGLRVAGR